MKLTPFIKSLGLDLKDPHHKDTPARFEKWLRDATANQNKEWPTILTTFPCEGGQPIVTVDDISFSSLCCHHLLPFFGVVSIEYCPITRVVGLSKFARAAEWLSLRAQTQEQFTRDLARMVFRQSQPHFVSVTVKATHTCMLCRGARQNAQTTTRFQIT